MEKDSRFKVIEDIKKYVNNCMKSSIRADKEWGFSSPQFKNYYAAELNIYEFLKEYEKKLKKQLGKKNEI